MAMLADHEGKRLVITVRGTASTIDAINDIGSNPKFFDPLGMEVDGHSNRRPPFDDEKDLFVHGAMLECARDVCRELHRSDRLEDFLRDNEGYRVVCTGHSMGAGIACLVALQLKRDLKELELDVAVHFVGFETPGALLSKRLSDRTQKLGWVSIVCAHDWVPRISVKALQKLKLKIIKELGECNKSKLQLSFLFMGEIMKRLRCFCCFRWILSKICTRCFQCELADAYADRQAFLNTAKSLIEEAATDELSEELLCAGHILYMRPLSHEWRCCRVLEKDTDWFAMWADPVDISELEVILSVRAIELHAPWVYEHAIDCVVKHCAEPSNPHNSGGYAKRIFPENMSL